MTTSLITFVLALMLVVGILLLVVYFLNGWHKTERVFTPHRKRDTYHHKSYSPHADKHVKGIWK